jgi:uncharacterized membrane protein
MQGRSERVAQGDRRSRVAALAAGSMACAFLAGTLLAPWLEARGATGVGARLRAIYAPVCHQRGERSVAIEGRPQAVCARCAGLYLGGASGLGAAAFLALGSRPRLRPRGSWLACALAPLAIDVALGWLGAHGLPNLPRVALAWPAGFVAGLLLALALGDLVADPPGPLASRSRLPLQR